MRFLAPLVLLLISCSSPLPRCDATTCTSGCCLDEHTCVAASDTACGLGGATCTTCALGQSCAAGTCRAPVGGGGGTTDAGSTGDAGTTVDAGSSIDAGTDAGVSHCSGVPAGKDAWSRTRTTVDQPDDSTLPQVHVLYVEPSDRVAPRQLDVEGDLRRSVAAMNAWLSLQTGGSTFRFDTCEGVVDITFVKLAVTETELATGLTDARFHGPDFIRDRLAALVKTDFHDPKKLYLVYYDGLAYQHCGGASYPPSLSDHYTAIFRAGIFAATYVTTATAAGATTVPVWSTSVLPAPPFSATLGTSTVNVTAVTATSVTLSAGLTAAVPAGTSLRASTTIPPCAANPLSPDGQGLGYADLSTMHELMHPLGIVGAGGDDFAQAPIAPGHLNDGNVAGGDDLMYQGNQAWTCGSLSPNATTARCKLDPAHRNYWKTDGGAGKVDLAQSAFLEPSPANAVLPANW